MKQCSHFWKAVILILPTLPTGRLPVRSGIYTAHDWPLDMGFRVFLPISEGGLPATEVTIPQVLKKANYTSALVGREGRMHILSTSYSIVPPLTFTLVLHSPPTYRLANGTLAMSIACQRSRDLMNSTVYLIPKMRGVLRIVTFLRETGQLARTNVCIA